MFHNKMFLFPGIRCKCFVAPVTWPPFFNCMTSVVETVQDFLIKLDIKPLMHLLKISIFSLNNDTVRLTKIMNNLVKDCKIRTFKVIFQCLKLVESFKEKFCEEYLIRRPTFTNDFFENFDFQSILFSKNVPNFCQPC